VRTKNIPDWEFLLQNAHQEGSVNAPIKLIEFSDFQCPYCKKLEPELKNLLKKYNGKMEIIYHYFPLPAHPQAFQAAKAAECAAEQNDFWKYHDLLFQNQTIFKQQPWDSLARISNIRNLDDFDGCMKDTLIDKVIEKDIKLGLRIGVEGTPTIVINGKLLFGVLHEDMLNHLVQTMLNNSYKKLNH